MGKALGVDQVDSDFLKYAGPAVLLLGYTAVLLLERARPLRQRKTVFSRRLATNVALTGLTFLAGGMVVRPAALGVSFWAEGRSFGLLNAFALPGWVKFAAAFLLMDLSFYYWHRINHTIPILWRFHSVHHIDQDLDATTSFRFHFGEVLYSVFFRVLQVGLLGIGPATYIVYELFFQSATLFHHSNLKLPIEVERRLNHVIVTPRMHGIHHSVVRSELNSNYSVIFRWWDALNGSLLLNIPQSAINIGVGRYQRPGDNSLGRLLALPFRSFAPERPGGRHRFGMSGRRVLAE